MFAVGAAVPWARAGVGAVATQAFEETAYAVRCLERLALGDPASVALDAARTLDPLTVLRQVGVVDANGNAAAFTGELCVDHCGHVVGDGWAVQANMMVSPDVTVAMASAYEASGSSSLALAHRLLAVLEAAQRAGGDARGQMAAALLVVSGERSDDPAAGRLIDIRVDRHDQPLAELARLLDAADAFNDFSNGVDALIAGDGQGALSTLDHGLALLPDEENLRFPRAGALALLGRLGDAAAEIQALIAARPSWAVVIDSFVAKGLMPAFPDQDPDDAQSS
jgi:uncharacterized Ntn-hydrolase superfamily protein